MSDLIRRQDAIDMFQQLAYDDWNQGVSTSWADAYAECAEMLRGLPSAEPERKKGKWITVFVEYPNKTGVIFECPLCWQRFKERTYFCPNCGAEMEADQ